MQCQCDGGLDVPRCATGTGNEPRDHRVPASPTLSESLRAAVRRQAVTVTDSLYSDLQTARA
eukprot:314984-Rhodomonas_salina.1